MTAASPLAFSIRNWLLAVVAATIAPILVLGSWLVSVEYDRARNSSSEQLVGVSRALLQAIEREFQHREGTLLALAASPALRAGNFDEFYKIAQAIVSRMPDTSGIILADESGQQIINTRRPLGTPLPKRGDLTPVKKVFETRRTWLSDLFMGALMNIPVVGIDIPVIQEGRVIYNLALSVPIEELNSILTQQRFPAGWIAHIVDRTGTIVSRSVDTEKWVGKKLAESLGVQLSLISYEGHANGSTIDGVPVLTAWSRSPEWGWTVTISQPNSQIRAALIANLTVLLFAGALALGIGLALASLISRRISTATLGLAASAAEIGTTDYLEQKPSGIIEIDSVSSKLTQTSELLHERALQRESAEEHQRLLMAELDHRVKNILATVQALARQSLGRSAEAERFSGRVMALARAHNVLATTRWRGASLSRLSKQPCQHIRVTGIELSSPVRARSSIPNRLNRWHWYFTNWP